MTEITLEKPSLATENLITGEALAEMGNIGRCELVERKSGSIQKPMRLPVKKSCPISVSPSRPCLLIKS
ncbi:MAG: hypothetical protein Fur0044_01470 [Anaerolineae bacterium]|nr:hypothetical protein [Anaerolineae bacterium]